MTDFEKFQDALHEEESRGVFGGEGSGGGGSGYMSSLLNSMSLVLEEFYAHLSMVGVSAMSGDGIKEFFEAVEEKRLEFERDYKPELERRRKEREEESAEKKKDDLTRFMRDMKMEGKGTESRGKGDMQVGSSSEEEEELDPEDYPDAEREDPDITLRKRYEAALRAGKIDGDEAAAQSAAVRGMRMS
jgi:GPN-loop GTPase